MVDDGVQGPHEVHDATSEASGEPGAGQVHRADSDHGEPGRRACSYYLRTGTCAVRDLSRGWWHHPHDTPRCRRRCCRHCLGWS
jgi:hypothetical protein